MGARWVDPALSRWLSADTLVPEPGKPQALNRYAYVTNNPINATDPSGHMPCGIACPYDYTTWEINFGAAYGGAWDPGQQAGNRSRAAQAVSLMLDLGPSVGDVKGLIEVGTGRDLVSGEALGAWRWVGLLGLVGLAEARALRYADEAVDAVTAARRLREVGVHADEAGDLIKTLAKSSTRGDPASKYVLLGSFPEYTDLAELEGMTYFDMPGDVWNTLSAAGEEFIEAVNMQFLEDAIASGKHFVVVLGEGKAPGKWLKKELQYLIERGYHLENGVWVPGQ